MKRVLKKTSKGHAQHYWCGRKFGFKPVILPGRDKNEVIISSEEKMASNKKLLDDKKLIVTKLPGDNRPDEFVLADIQARKGLIRQKIKDELKYAPIEDLRTQLDNAGMDTMVAEDKLLHARTEQERRIANDDLDYLDEKLFQIKRKLHPSKEFEMMEKLREEGRI